MSSCKGFQQAVGIDYGETFSFGIKPTTRCIVLTLAVTFNWEIDQLNVNNAFLNRYLQEKVYMNQHEGFTYPKYPFHVCKLVKLIYGLKQTPIA